MRARSPLLSDNPLDLLKLLADDTRWRLIAALRKSDRQVGELVSTLKLPQNLVSYHLGILRQAGIVRMRHSDTDARVLFYGLDTAALQDGYQRAASALHLPGVPATANDLAGAGPILFLCTGNSARSQMAEGWLRYLSAGRVPVRSAGTEPRGLDPLAVRVMAEADVDIGYQHSKGLEAIRDITPSVVVTVCDLAREHCPEWANDPTTFHWSVPDPVRVAGEAARLSAFYEVRDELRQRIQGLLALLPTLPGHPANAQTDSI
jgi:ArsR family transcriptional regulator, arsenate/arsenite/antimonite-responsive transcriptional repressor / arsenate reductase (thioredoxin)